MNLKAKVREPDPPGVIPQYIITQMKVLSWIATGTLVYFLYLFSLDAARDTAHALQVTHLGTWVASGEGLKVWFPTVLGFLGIVVVIPLLTKIAIPAFVLLDWKAPGQAWPKSWLLILIIAGSAVVLSGTISVQHGTRLEGAREAAIVEQQAGASLRALEAQKAQAEKELQTMLDNRNSYLAQAANVGALEWQKSYIDTLAPNDPQRDRIVRALGAARAADAKRAEIADLTRQIASAPTQAETSERVVRSSDQAVTAVVDQITAWRSVALALVVDMVALLMPWISLRMEQARARQLAALAPQVATVDESHMIPHFTDQVTPQPMDPPMEAYDENGERLVFRKGHYAKKAAKKKAKESDKPVPLSDTDPRVVRDLEAQSDGRGAEGASDRPGNAPDDRPDPAPAGLDAAGVDGRGQDQSELAETAPTQDALTTAERVLTIEEAEALVSAGTHAWDVDDAGNRFVRELEAQAKALPNGEGVMIEERAG
jgi:hypothetical protein